MRLAAALLALALAIGVSAVVDHRLKQRRIERVEVAEWYCSHQGIRCGGPSSAGIERHWNERQVGYEIAASVLAASGVVVALRRARRR